MMRRHTTGLLLAALGLVAACGGEGAQPPQVPSGKPVESWLDEAYIAALSRLPSAAEKEAVSQALAEAKDGSRLVMEDVYWALISSREFIFNH